MISDAQAAMLRDLTVFAPAYFKIAIKSAEGDGDAIIPLTLNPAQLYIHSKLEEQLKATGKIRAIILKGRQQGCSTYIQARYFHKILTQRGKKAFILTHAEDATNNLFGMAKTYYDNLPEGLAPKPDRLNTTEMYFNYSKSGYKVGTAGSKKVGRSQTNQLFHGSECGFWDNTDEHSAGILQTIAKMKGTEIILESTANGIGNFFHKEWCAAVSGKSEYLAIFVPWYWQTEYKATAEGMTLDEEENRLMQIYAPNGLTREHLAWRRIATIDLNKDPDKGAEKFKQEYPFNATEAFLNPIDNAFINAKYVNVARVTKVDTDAGLIIGVDPAGDKEGSDRTAIICRKGRKAYDLRTYRNQNTMQICGILVEMFRKEMPKKVYIDSIGLGKGIVDRLQEMGYNFVEGINVANHAANKKRFKNRRAELWNELADWLMQDLPIEIPDSDELQGDICSPGCWYNSTGQLIIESKDDLKARGMPSPDCADALIHTFSGGFYETHISQAVEYIRPPAKGMFM